MEQPLNSDCQCWSVKILKFLHTDKDKDDTETMVTIIPCPLTSDELKTEDKRNKRDITEGVGGCGGT